MIAVDSTAVASEVWTVQHERLAKFFFTVIVNRTVHVDIIDMMPSTVAVYTVTISREEIAEFSNYSGVMQIGECRDKMYCYTKNGGITDVMQNC